MERFNVVLTGKLLPGTDFASAIDQLMALTRLDRTRAEGLFATGQPVVVKRELSPETAEQYRATLNRIGIEVALQRCSADPAAGADAPALPPHDAPPSPEPEQHAAPPPAPEPAGVRQQRTAPHAAAQPVRVPASHGWKWMKDAIGLFLDQQLLWLGMTLTLGILMTLVSMIPVLGSLITSLTGPVFAGGLMLGAHGQQQGQPLRFTTLFEGFSHNRNQLLRLGALQTLMVFALFLVFGALVFVGFLLIGSGNGSNPLRQPQLLAQNLPLALIAALLGLVGAALVSMAFWFAPCLVAISDLTAGESIRASFRSALRNWSAILVFGLVSLVALIAVFIVLVLAGMLAQLALHLDFPPLATQLVVLLLFSPTIALFTLASYTAFRDIFLARG